MVTASLSIGKCQLCVGEWLDAITASQRKCHRTLRTNNAALDGPVELFHFAVLWHATHRPCETSVKCQPCAREPYKTALWCQLPINAHALLRKHIHVDLLHMTEIHFASQFSATQTQQQRCVLRRRMRCDTRQIMP